METVSILSSIEFQMSLLLFVALAGYIIASKINQSAVVGVILGGIIIGPSFLGLITYTDFVSSIAHLGAIILLFVIGLEFKLNEIMKWKYGVIAFFGVLIPWIGGYIISLLFGFDFTEAVFIGTALTATSIAITANVLREMGKLQTDVAKAIIGAAVIDDILSLIALSISNQVITSLFSFSTIFLILLKVSIFLILGLLIGYFLVSVLIGKIDSSKLGKKYPELVFIFAMMFAFLYSMISQWIGLSAIVGAFIAGVSLEEAKIVHSKSYRHGAEYLYIIFASIFFVSLGVLADFSALNLSTLFFVFILTLVAILTKLIACGLSSYFLGMKKGDAFLVGIGMAPRGEVTMIVALIGLNMSIIGEDIYVSLVIMSLLTTILSPLLIKYYYNSNSNIKIK